MNLAILKQIALLRKKSLLVLAVFFSVTLVLQGSITYYQQPMLEKLRTEWLKQRELEGRGASLQSRELLYKNGLADLGKFRDRIYPKSDFARFIGELYNVATRNGLELTAISYKPTANKEEKLLEYQLAVTARGHYPQLKKFISELGVSSNILVIDAISLASTDASADTVQLQIRLTSYFKMEGQ